MKFCSADVGKWEMGGYPIIGYCTMGQRRERTIGRSLETSDSNFWANVGKTMVGRLSDNPCWPNEGEKSVGQQSDNTCWTDIGK